MRSWDRCYATVILAAGALLMLSAACRAEITASDVESKLRAKVLRDWTAESLSIKVIPYTSSARTRKGQFAQMSFVARSAEEKEKHIKVVELNAVSRDVQLDLNAFNKKGDVKILSTRSSTMNAKLMESDINKLLALKKSPIQNLQVDFGNGDLTFTGKYKLNVSLTGEVLVKKGYELHFKPTQASIGILGVPLGIVNRFLSNLNPIIDLRKVPLQPQIKRIIITPTYLVASG